MTESEQTDTVYLLLRRIYNHLLSIGTADPLPVTKEEISEIMSHLQKSRGGNSERRKIDKFKKVLNNSFNMIENEYALIIQLLSDLVSSEDLERIEKKYSLKKHLSNSGDH